MRTYEIMCVYIAQEGEFLKGLQAVKEVLEKLEAQIIEEKDMGVKQLAYEIKSQTHAHYLYFIVNLEPDKAHMLRHLCRMIIQLLRMLVILKN